MDDQQCFNNPLIHNNKRDTLNAINGALALLQSLTAFSYSLHEDDHAVAGFIDTLDDIRDVMDGMTDNPELKSALHQIALVQTAVMDEATDGDAGALLGLHQRLEKARRLCSAAMQEATIEAA